MRYDEFISRVQDRARLPDKEKAELATRATLETLGERIPEGLAGNVAAQLPPEAGESLRRAAASAGEGTGERFDRREFLARIRERIGDDEPETTYEARMVFEVMAEATGPGMMTRIREALPKDVRELVGAGGTG
jgi:uncharacterized protein (DUF2267 family)